jgi:hypothetical protein
MLPWAAVFGLVLSGSTPTAAVHEDELPLAGGGPATPRPPQGNVSAVEDLLDRVLPGAREHFQLAIDASACSSNAGCFTLEDGSGGTLKVTGSTTSDVSAGVGAYLMDHANMTIGWARGGGQHLFLPERWPMLGKAVTKQRITPWSYIMNVCTHSYSLVWYSWAEWEAFIDWQALWGINLNLAMTGQEEVQWKVFTQLGLNDSEIRGWFNGPALLTWSRGGHSHSLPATHFLIQVRKVLVWSRAKRVRRGYRRAAAPIVDEKSMGPAKEDSRAVPATGDRRSAAWLPRQHACGDQGAEARL